MNQSKQNIESIFPLRDAQAALLWLRETSVDDPGTLTAVATLKGKLDRQRFERVWAEEFQIHEMLRASVYQRENKRPMLLVWKKVQPSIEFVEATNVGPDEQADQEQQIAQSHRRNIDLQQSPNSHLTLLTTGPNQHKLIWTFHHLFMDGWSTAAVLRNTLARYSSKVIGASYESPLRLAYQDFHASRKHTPEAFRAYWTGKLANFRGHRRLAPQFVDENDSQPQQQKFGSVSTTLSESQTSKIQQMIAAQNLTLSAVTSAAWAIVHSQLHDEPESVFGMTVAGRASHMTGIQEIVGLLANVIPVRIPVNGDLPLSDLLNETRNQHFESQPFETVTPTEIHDCCQMDADRALYETLMVVENFPISFDDAGNSVSIETLSLTHYHSGTTSRFPISCYIVPGATWDLRIEFDRSKISPELAEALLQQFVDTLQRFTEVGWDAKISEILEPSSDFVALKETVRFESISTPMITEAVNVDYDQKNETELKVTSVWEEVLGIASIGVNENFFSIGGKSITAVRLLARIEDEFGLRFPPTAILQNPTIRSMSSLIAEGEENKIPSLVRFKRTTQGSPVVCIHAGGGYATYYRFLAKHLADRPVVGLQPKGLQDGLPLTTLEQIAQHYNRQLVDAFCDGQTENPFHLVGYCMGAAVTLEMARQMEKQGIPVQAVTIIDSGPNWIKARSERRKETYSIRRSVREWPYRVRKQWRNYRHERSQFADARKLLQSGKAEDRSEYFRLRVEKASSKALANYRPQCCQTRIQLIRSSHYAGMDEKDFHLDWKHLTASQFHIETVDSIHEEILMEPAAGRVAELIEKWSRNDPTELR